MTAPHSPNADGRAEKRFPCRPVRGWTLGALVRAFGEFAPRADSGLRGAGQADADGGEPAPRELRENRPWTRRECPGDNPPPKPAGRILPPPKKKPHLTDCRRPFPPPRAAADGRRMLRAGPARRRRCDRATCPAFFAPHCQRECAAAVRNRRGMSHRARRRR